jgi:hypothetical protein
LDFFHSLFELGRRGDVGGVESRADPSASLRDLFFLAPALAFAPLDREDFILQVHGVSLAFARGLHWWRVAAARADLQTTAR